MPNRSFFLKIEVCFSKVGVCFYRKSEFVFWQAEYAFIENRSLFFENRSLFFLKIGVWFLEIGVCLFWKSEFVFWKSEYWPQILSCHSALEFEQNQWRIQGRGRGTCPSPHLYFWTKLRPEGRKKNFLETTPLLISGSGWPPLPLIWRSLFQFSLTYGNKRPGRFI